MNNSVVILDSSDDEVESDYKIKIEQQSSDIYETIQKDNKKAYPLSIVNYSDKEPDIEVKHLKRLAEEKLSNEPPSKIKRIPLQTVSRTVSKELKANIDEIDSDCEINFNIEEAEHRDPGSMDTLNVDIKKEITVKCASDKTPMHEHFKALLVACKKADPSNDMNIVCKKLIRYYEMVHPDFVNSKSFCKMCQSVANEIDIHSELVYLKISVIFEELNIRRKSRCAVMSNENNMITSTGNARKDLQIKRLNHALYILKKKIQMLDEAEVNLEDETNSTFLMVERYKKRACEIYEKICDITGESKHAHRAVRKPITFSGTHFAEFNRTIETFVNRTRTFPDMFDVLRCLEHCNKQYDYKMGKEEIKRIAQDAFIKIGKSLQKRRKTDLYETVSYFSGSTTEGEDPAQNDSTLLSKLNENKKFHSRINNIIDKYAAKQDAPVMTINSDDESDENRAVNEHYGHHQSVECTGNNNKHLIEIDKADEVKFVNLEKSKEIPNEELIPTLPEAAVQVTNDINNAKPSMAHNSNINNNTSSSSSNSNIIDDNEIIISDDDELILIS